MSPRCEWCGREANKVYTHHLIPRWLIGLSDETMEVCYGCHAKLDRRIENFIHWGSFSPVEWHNKIKEKNRIREWQRRLMGTRQLFRKSIEKRLHLSDIILFNRKTKYVCFRSYCETRHKGKRVVKTLFSKVTGR